MFDWENQVTRKDFGCGNWTLTCNRRPVAFFFYEEGFVKHYDIFGQELTFDNFLTIADAKQHIENDIKIWVCVVAEGLKVEHGSD